MAAFSLEARCRQERFSLVVGARSAAEFGVRAGRRAVGSVPGMERSKVEHALSKAVVDAEPAPSDLALEAIVTGIPVDETRPKRDETVDLEWPEDDIPL